MSITTKFPMIRPTLNLDFVNSLTVDPRITFTRASTATFYDGRTFAKAEENLLLRSQEFDNAVWVKASASVTANTGAAPDRTTTADTLTASGPNGSALQTFTALAEPYTFSLWVRRTVGTGTVEITVDGSTWSAITITETWARFSITATPSAGSRTAGIRLATNGDAVEIWGAQLEQRSTVTAYTPTTDQPITRYVPQLMTAAANVPRIDFDPVTGACRGLLIEEQRTNLLLRSQEFDNVYWARARSSVVPNAAIAPDGTLTACKIVEDTSSGTHYINSQYLTSGTLPTGSVYVKAAERTYCTFQLIKDNGTGFAASSSFNINLVDGSFTGGGGANPTVTSAGNGWWRISLTATDATSTNFGVRIALGIPSGSYTGDGFSGIFIWGAQLEAGAFPTSYIPTVASQVTRSADSAVMTGTNFSSWYRQDEGSFLVDGSFNQASKACRLIDAHRSGSYDDQLYLQRNAGNGYSIQSGAGGNQNGNAAAGTSTVSSFKLAGAYRTNDYAASLNGGVVGTDTSATVPNGINGMNIGSHRTSVEVLNGHLRRIAYWPARLANAQLQAITA